MCKSKSIGGQALIEGVMMRGPKFIAVAVRKPDGGIQTKVEPIPEVYSKGIFQYPIIRGIGALVSSMSIGIGALTYSADIAGYAEEDSKFDKWIRAKFGENAENILKVIAIASSFILAIAVFGVLPTLISALLKNWTDNAIILSAMEGIVKLVIFLSYIFFISKIGDVHRVFEYHGAEHMSIHCLEAGLDLTPDNVKKFSPIHERCGTSFLIYLMILSIAIYSFIPWSSLSNRVLIKILLLPVISGLGYEVLKLNARVNNPFLKFLSKPGLWVQKITTQVPDEAQIQVAIASLKSVLSAEGMEEGHIDCGCEHAQ